MIRIGCFLLMAGVLLAACGPEPAGPSDPGQPHSESRENNRDGVTQNGAAKAFNPQLQKPDQANAAAAKGGPQDLKPNVIRWSTASEHDSFGYDIYRGASEAGPFEVVNPEVIPGAGTTDMPSSYEFVDEAVEPGITYWYFIESISLTGERKRITPVYPSKRKPAEQESG